MKKLTAPKAGVLTVKKKLLSLEERQRRVSEGQKLAWKRRKAESIDALKSRISDLERCVFLLAAGVGTYERNNPNQTLRNDLDEVLKLVNYGEMKE